MRPEGREREEYEIQNPAIKYSSRFITALSDSEDYEGCCGPVGAGRLGCAGDRDDKFLVFEDAIGVADGRIGGSQTGPVGGAAEVSFSQIPQGIASVHDNCWAAATACFTC